MNRKDEDRFAKLAHKQGFKTLGRDEMAEIKRLAEKKGKETKRLQTPKRRPN